MRLSRRTSRYGAARGADARPVSFSWSLTYRSIGCAAESESRESNEDESRFLSGSRRRHQGTSDASTSEGTTSSAEAADARIPHQRNERKKSVLIVFISSRFSRWNGLPFTDCSFDAGSAPEPLGEKSASETTILDTRCSPDTHRTSLKPKRDR